MKDKPISDLRRRMLEDMAVRRLGEKTRHDYIKHIETFTRFLGRSPDAATAEDLRRFQVHELEQGGRPPKMNTQVSALRFFFGKTLGRLDLAHQLSRVDYPRKLPRVLPMNDVTRLLEAAPGPGLKYKAALSIAYGAGLRGGEVVMLRVCDIDSKRHADPGRARQGPEGSTRHTLAATVGNPARLVDAVSLEGLVVSGPGPAAADDGAPAQPCLPSSRRCGGARYVDIAANVAPFVRNASDGGWRRCQDHPGVVGPCEVGHDRALYARRHQYSAHHREPARPSDAGDPDSQANDGAGRVDRLTCPVQRWRSRRSSATTALLGVVLCRATFRTPSSR